MAAPTKRTKRQRGSIDKLSSGTLRVRVYAGHDPVSKREHYLTETIPAGPNAERQAEKARTRLLNQVDEQRNPRTNATLAQLIEKHLSVAELDPGTLRGYRRNYENHVKPLIGATKVGAIDAHVLDSFYAELRRCRAHCDGRTRIDHRTHHPHACDERCGKHVCQPLATSTVRRVHFLLSGAFKRAVRWGWIAHNPAAKAEPPPEPKPDPQPPTAAEAARIVNAAWEDPDWGAFVWLAMNTGGRRAELCALRWRHVDLTNGTLDVRKSIDQSGGETTEKDTKTHQHRRIAIDPETVIVLTDQRSRCMERAQALGIELSDDAFVFSLAPDGNSPMKPDTVTQRYGRLAKRLKIATTFHKLRHFSATELIAAGVDPRTVSGRLGHTGGGSTTLRVYSAWVSESDQRAASSLSSRMPARPTDVATPTERAKTDPRSPYEKVAAQIRNQILSGNLKVGAPAPTQKEITKTHCVSAGTANRAIELLKSWNLVDATRGRRAVVLEPPEDASPESTPRNNIESHPPNQKLIEARLIYLGELVRTFKTEADVSDGSTLRQLLANAVRRHQGRTTTEIGDYELEIRQEGKDPIVFAEL
ncbi:hypothetical protein CFN78_18880 [Amycolatopsis antarctica]|uniref:Site-specific integrase n=1 Tax=Amycolatopsis antarctica TaxID=1854586 RepID=A0A263CZJ4_9PSEU|nr:tyrosine-type recombinase/integrase [Amycolatopsis antarctica]OZM71593.1 hypothetical protein CFN78_18880 [Amycolatopsis antarctica]